VTSVLVVGEVIADFLPLDGEPRRFDCALGGSGFNTALALARLEVEARFAWSFSRDQLGVRFQRMLAGEGVDLSLSRITDAPTALAVVEPSGASHGAMFALHLAGTAHEEPPVLPARLPDGMDHLHVASFAVTAGAAAADSLSLMRAARGSGSVSYDPNIRASCLPPHAESLALVEARVAASTIAKASIEDLGWLYPALQPHEALERWRMLGADICIATRGPQGALALGADGTVEVPTPKVDVIDTVGAGDTFNAGLIASLRRQGRLGPMARRIDRAELAAALAFAARAAAVTCARPGCDPPRLAELHI
jgi:fructokinase